ncbi:lactonohydrolase [Paraphaeosphaeria sporulosa]
MSLENSYLGALPAGFSTNVSGLSWGYYSTALNFDINRTGQPAKGLAQIAQLKAHICVSYRATMPAGFVAFGPSSFDIIGPNAKSEHVQHLLHAETYESRNITTSPPITQAHGCSYRNGSLYIATAGSNGTCASIFKVNPDSNVDVDVTSINLGRLKSTSALRPPPSTPSPPPPAPPSCATSGCLRIRSRASTTGCGSVGTAKEGVVKAASRALLG